jgi:hypothetical protein
VLKAATLFHNSSSRAYYLLHVTKHDQSTALSGDARHIAVQLEVPLTVSILDSTGHLHTHTLWYTVLDDLSHDIIIGLMDLIGPFYTLFETSVALSRRCCFCP